MKHETPKPIVWRDLPSGERNAVPVADLARDFGMTAREFRKRRETDLHNGYISFVSPNGCCRPNTSPRFRQETIAALDKAERTARSTALTYLRKSHLFGTAKKWATDHPDADMPERFDFGKPDGGQLTFDDFPEDEKANDE